eukprot:RCo006568
MVAWKCWGVPRTPSETPRFRDAPNAVRCTPLQHITTCSKSYSGNRCRAEGQGGIPSALASPTPQLEEDGPVCSFCGVRRGLQKALHSWVYSGFTVLVILTNTAFLCAFDNTNSDSRTQQVVRESKVYFNAFFAFDAVLHVVARGPVESVRDGWFLLESLTVLLGFLTYIPNVVDFTAIRLLLVIKFLPRIPFLRKTEIMTKAISRSLPLLRDFFLLALFFFLFFGILGIELFRGRFGYRCVDPFSGAQLTNFWYGSDPDKVCSSSRSYGFQCPGNATCMDLRLNPESGTMGYDNILLAWLTIFLVESTQNWSVVLYHSFDATSGAAFLFHASIVIIGMYLLVHSVAGVVTTKLSEVSAEYAAETAESSESTELPAAADTGGVSPDMVSCQTPFVGPESAGHLSEGPVSMSMDMSSALQPLATATVSPGVASPCSVPVDMPRMPVPSWKLLQLFLRRLTHHKIFEGLVVCTIVANIVVLAIPYVGMTPQTLDRLALANKVFTCVFAAEALLRILGDGPRAYFGQSSNVFDFCIVILGIIDDFVLTGISTGLSALRAVRAVRALRAVRLGRYLPQLERLGRVLRDNVGMRGCFLVVWFLFVVVFCCCGMQLFSGYLGPAEGDSRENFDSFGWGLLATIQLFTYQNWCELDVSTAEGRGLPATIFPVVAVTVGAYILSQMPLA